MDMVRHNDNTVKKKLFPVVVQAVFNNQMPN